MVSSSAADGLQGLSCSDVEQRLIDGEIYIGEPPYNPETQYLAQIDRSLRYAVVDRQFRTEPTEQGNQYVIPGCEHDWTRGGNDQGRLF